MEEEVWRGEEPGHQGKTVARRHNLLLRQRPNPVFWKPTTTTRREEEGVRGGAALKPECSGREEEGGERKNLGLRKRPALAVSIFLRGYGQTLCSGCHHSPTSSQISGDYIERPSIVFLRYILLTVKVFSTINMQVLKITTTQAQLLVQKVVEVAPKSA